MTIPATFTTQLAAVNELLQSIGQAPVTAVDPTLSVDVAAATIILDRISLKMQSKGWHWNRDEQVLLSPDGSGHINLPTNVLWIANAYSPSQGCAVRVAERARMLYDRDNHTNVFTSAVVVDTVTQLIWDDMPEYARQAITQAAIEVFQVRLQGDTTIERVERDAVGVANALLEQREDEADEQNCIGGNQYVANTLYGGPRRRNR